MSKGLNKIWSGLGNTARGGLMALVLGVNSLAPGCGAMINGTTQNIHISSEPSGADVNINNMSHGKTPVYANLKRTKSHNVNIKKEGYSPYSCHISSDLNGWFWFDLIFWGAFGLIDLTGGGKTLSPEFVNVNLSRIDAMPERRSDERPVKKLRQDELYLTDGSIIRGRLLEEKRGESYKIRLKNGSDMIYPAEKVKTVKFDRSIDE